MAYYKVTDPGVFTQINRLLTERAEIVKLAKVFAELVKAPAYSLQDDLFFGLRFEAVGIKTIDLVVLDKTKWKTRKTSNPDYYKLEPRRTNKAFSAFYDNHFPKDEFSYAPLLELILTERYLPFEKGGIGINYVGDKFFAFTCNGHSVRNEVLTEITAEEYENLAKENKKISSKNTKSP